MIHITYLQLTYYAIALLCLGVIGILSLVAYQIFRAAMILKKLFLNVKIVTMNTSGLHNKLKENFIETVTTMASIFLRQQLAR